MLATNNGDVAGGEVMLLRIAEGLRQLGWAPLVAGPAEPGELLARARERGFDTETLPAAGRAAYLRALRRWRPPPARLVWCNGLVPALATAGRRRRLVHLHQEAFGLHRPAARLARLGAERVVVPSQFMTTRVPGSVALRNWTDEPTGAARDGVHAERGAERGVVRLGFLGRHSTDKGLHLLADAVATLRAQGADRIRLVVGGDARHVPSEQSAPVRAALSRLDGAVEDLGWVDRDAFLDRVDLAVFPSVWAEPFGLVAAEAMAAGVPLVVSDAGALPEVVGAQHPWVARAGDVADLTRVLGAAVAALAAGRTDAVAREARQRWQREFSPEAGVARLEALVGRAPA